MSAAEATAVFATRGDATAVFATRGDVAIDERGGNAAAWLLTGASSAGRASASEVVSMPGADTIDLALPVNRYLFVVSGGWRIIVDGTGTDRALGADDVVFLPAAIRASIQLTGAEQGKLFLLTVPAER